MEVVAGSTPFLLPGFERIAPTLLDVLPLLESGQVVKSGGS